MPPRYYGALVLYLAVAALFIHDWDGYVFEQSVRDFWDGYSPYTVAQEGPYYTYLNEVDASPQWYAYPPLPLLAMSVTFLPEHFIDAPPIVERVLLKLPMVFGTLALAAIGGAWAQQLGYAPKTRLRVERILLFNPFLVIVGPTWGMTDPALVALFLAGALRFDQARYYESGAYFALSALVKPFPVLLALPLVAYYIHTSGWKPIGKVLAAGLPLGAAITLPFVLSNPQGYWQQVVGMHLRRDPQGLTLWSIRPLNEMTPEAIGATSLTLLAITLLALSFLAPRLKTRSAPLVLLLATSALLLLWNRVVNEQYLVLVVAPLLLLYGLGVLEDPASRFTARWAPLLFAGITLFQGFHFLRFIPPDMEWLLFGSADVTVLANKTRQFFNWGLENPFPDYTPSVFVALVLFVVAALGLRYLSRAYERPQPGGPKILPSGPTASALGCVVLLLLGFTPLVSPAAVGPASDAYLPAAGEPLVGAFYYLWWNNPAHNPNLEAPYGNWADVSQVPELGYYTQTRGVSRVHAQMMRENGIDVAIVSYHTGEQERYRVFQEEAARQGILVAPLIELNQIYDRPEHKSLMPQNASGEIIDYGSYRLTDDTRRAIEEFVLEVGPMLQSEGTYREDGRPVVFFYDSYVSGVGNATVEQEAFTKTLRALGDLRPTLPALDAYVGSEDLTAVTKELLDRYPRAEDDLHKAGLYGAVARQTHLELHSEFWRQLRANLEAKLGPLFLVSGDAFNERAGFETGTIKSLVNLEIFDGSFIYSPSFTWGVQPKDELSKQAVSFENNFALWEDRNIWLTSFAAGLDRYSAFGVAPSYDDTELPSRRDSFIIPAYPYNDPRYEASTYHRSWARTLMNPPSLVVVATFNEFFEGSSVEPSEEYGATFLNMTREYRDQLRRQSEPAERVVAVIHERSSRLHPGYDDRDLSHDWGLNLTAAAGRVFGGESPLLAVDALETQLAGLDRQLEGSAGRPALLLIDGGRGNFTFSDAMMERIQDWITAGVPTLVLGPKVSPPVGPLVGQTDSLLTWECKIQGTELDRDTLAPGDRLVTDGQSLYLERHGLLHFVPIAYRCPDRPNLAFTTVKPWAGTGLANAECLGLMLHTLFPRQAPTTAAPECSIPGFATVQPTGEARPGESAIYELTIVNPGPTSADLRLTVGGLDGLNFTFAPAERITIPSGKTVQANVTIGIDDASGTKPARLGVSPFTVHLWVGNAMVDEQTLYLDVLPRNLE